MKDDVTLPVCFFVDLLPIFLGDICATSLSYPWLAHCLACRCGTRQHHVATVYCSWLLVHRNLVCADKTERQGDTMVRILYSCKLHTHLIFYHSDTGRYRQINILFRTIEHPLP